MNVDYSLQVIPVALRCQKLKHNPCPYLPKDKVKMTSTTGTPGPHKSGA